MAQPPLSPSSIRQNPAEAPAATGSSTNRPASLKTDSAMATPRKDAHTQPSPSPAVSHRSSYAENLRNYPPSPRASRTPSFSGPALTELLMNPSTKPNGADSARFRGRDWRNIQIAEIIDPAETRFVELDTSLEDTTKLLIRSGAPNVVLTRASRKTRTAIGVFDYSDLNAYLLLVLGLSHPDQQAAQLAERARNREPIPLSDLLDHLGSRDEPAFLPHSATLHQAMEVLGSGVHRLVVQKEGTSEAVGVLTQLRLVRFFWQNHQNFTATERLYAYSLKELELGTKEVVAINGDKPLADALRLMHNEGVTSLPVLDNHRNVVGNISHVDVRLLTDTSAIPLLSSSCIHFISVILSERGLYDGKDSYPVFHVNPFSTLAHTVAKLCATRSHRMWIVDAPSPSGSVPPSPGVHSSMPPLSLPRSASPSASSHRLPLPAQQLATPARQGGNTGPEVTTGPPYTAHNASVSAAQLPGASMSGHLSGVVSLTDVLNVFARASGLSPGDPEELRRRRRRSSSSSSRAGLDSMRASAEFMRSSADLGRSSSTSSRR